MRRIGLGAGLIGLAALLAAALPQAAETQPASGGPAARSDGDGWGVATGGLRMRVLAPAGLEYRPRSSLPLVVEVQNVGNQPQALERLSPTFGAEATASMGERLTITRLVGPSPWGGRKDALPPGAVLRWTLPFEQLPFAAPPSARPQAAVRAGAVIGVRFSLEAMDAQAPGRVLSNTVQVAVAGDPTTARIVDADLPDRWAPGTDFAYQECRSVWGWWALHIDGDGRVRMFRSSSFKGDCAIPEGLTETVLGREPLDEFAKLIRRSGVLRLGRFAELRYEDEPEVTFCVAAGGAATVGRFAQHVMAGHTELAAFTQGVQRLVYAAVAVARADGAGWGEAAEGVQCRLRTDKATGGESGPPIFTADVRNRGVRELSVAQAQQLCELEVDGDWYVWGGDIDVKGSVFSPSRQYDGIRITLDRAWQGATGRRPLGLATGKHTLRVAFVARPVDPDTGPAVRAVSNRIEIEFAPAAQPGAQPGRQARDD